jgi:meckelin
MWLQGSSKRIWVLCCLAVSVQSIVVMNTSACASTQYFNTTTLDCVSCPIANSERSPDNFSCVCKAGYKAVYGAMSQELQSCTICSGLYSYSSDPTRCFDATTNVAQVGGLPTCTSNNYEVYLNSAGVLDCRPCPYNQFSVAKVTTGGCIRCPHPKQKYTIINGVYRCSCSSDASYQDIDGTGTCILRSEASKLDTFVDDKVIVYNQVEVAADSFSRATIESEFLKANYKEAYFNCLLSLNITACQLLANLCVLKHFDEDSATCKAFIRIQDSLPTVSTGSFSE